MRRVVVDTSALIRLYVPDGEVPAGLVDDIDRAVSGDTALLVPDLALAEAGQVLRKKEQSGFLSPSETDEILGAILDLPLDVVGHRGLLTDAIAVGRAHNLTVYDALFLALALDRRAYLMTADARLMAAFSSEQEPS